MLHVQVDSSFIVSTLDLCVCCFLFSISYPFWIVEELWGHVVGSWRVMQQIVLLDHFGKMIENDDDFVSLLFL